MQAEVIKFAEFELDLGRYELRRQGQAVKLEKVPMELLILLAEKEGQLVTREEIIQRLWGDNVFVDARQGINTAISKIRVALKDDPEQPRILQTVFGKGYRLMAPIEREIPVVGQEAKLAGTASTPLPTPESKIGSPAAEGSAPHAEHRDLMKPGQARALFLLIQAGYLFIYGATFMHFQQIQRLGEPHFVPQATLLLGLVGAPVRLYLISAVGLNYAGAGQLFRRAFPGILVLDVLWAAAPLLLFHKMGEITFLFVAALAFLPFSQRTLISCAYPPTPAYKAH
ncbi:MAG: winged helix-turn-helix domain-containing protein [Terriglobia bacterium]